MATSDRENFPRNDSRPSMAELSFTSMPLKMVKRRGCNLMGAWQVNVEEASNCVA